LPKCRHPYWRNSPHLSPLVASCQPHQRYGGPISTKSANTKIAKCILREMRTPHPHTFYRRYIVTILISPSLILYSSSWCCTLAHSLPCCSPRQKFYIETSPRTMLSSLIVPLISVPLMDVPLIGVPLVGASRGCASYGCASHGVPLIGVRLTGVRLMACVS
jgi:hypothetical protein